MTNFGYALARAELIRALTAYSGITTANGAADGTTLIDAALIDNAAISPSGIPEKTVLIITGDARGEDKGAVSFDNTTGEITLQGTGFSAQIKAGTIYRILNISSIEVDVANIDTKIGTNTDPAGTTTLFAWQAKLLAHGGQGLVYYGKVTQVDDGTHFRVDGLTGFGNDYFANNYRVYVVRDAAGAGAVPQGEMQPCSDYDSTDGIFTHTAFTADLAVDDEVLLLHVRVAEIKDLIDRLTAVRAGYLDELDFDLQGTLATIAAYIDTEIAALVAALGNPTADMSAVTQADDASLSAYIARFKEHYRAHDQTRICLIVPDLAGLAADLQNTAIRAELDLIGTVSVLDQTGVDAGQEDWALYDLVVVGSNAHAAFVMANIDDLISYHGPIMVCNADVAEHLLMGTEAAQSTSDTTEYCETIANRVMQLVFGSLGEKVLFDSAQVSDRLDMSAAALTEQVLMVDTTGEGPGLTVVGWLPAESADGEGYELNDGSSIPSGRLFAGCFVHADHLTDLGTSLLRRIARNLTEAHLHPLTVNVKRAYQEDIPDTDFALAAIDTVHTVDPPACDPENSIVDIDEKNGRTYVLRSLWVNVTNFGAGTQLTFELWVLINGVVTSVDSVVVNALGIQNLMDLFGLPEVHADGIWITVITDVGATGACSGTFRYAEAKK